MYNVPKRDRGGRGSRETTCACEEDNTPMTPSKVHFTEKNARAANTFWTIKKAADSQSHLPAWPSKQLTLQISHVGCEVTVLPGSHLLLLLLPGTEG